MNLLRFITAGNVDDGKSTLIGRLLFDSNAISTDILQTLSSQSKVKGVDTDIDLALLTDGLRAEREQGITIDVAYKYFSTPKRKFIIADTPGHSQYTRNMFTGASNADLAILLLDVRHGITDQTKRHSIISSILNIQNIVVCINKMDLEGYSEAIFEQIKTEFTKFALPLGFRHISFIPVSALEGDNVVQQSKNMPWYKDETLLSLLENIDTSQPESLQASRFQVQYVIRPQTNDFPDYRGFAGKVFSGTYSVGDRVKVLPSGTETTLASIEINQQQVSSADAGQPVVFQLADKIDVGRGNTIVPLNQLPRVETEFTATLCWMDNNPLLPGQKLLLQQNSFLTKALIKEILHKIDIHTFNKSASDGTLNLNDICTVSIKTALPLCFDPYLQNRHTGAFILINEQTKNTVAAGVIL